MYLVCVNYSSPVSKISTIKGAQKVTVLINNVDLIGQVYMSYVDMCLMCQVDKSYVYK